MNISVCIATYRRPERLRTLLDDLVHQQRLPQEVIVVDNDSEGSARAVVENARASGAPFTIRYDIQAQKNVSLTRNRTVALARSEWLAFIDDDERAPAFWLQRLEDAARRFNADGVLGPVDPIVPDSAPHWLRRGHFYHWARMKTGVPVPAHHLRFGNVLLNACWLKAQDPMFDPAYGLTGGEDGDLLNRLVQAGARIVWCDEADVKEPVESSRLSLRWLLLRSMRGGQDFMRHSLAGRYGPVTATSRAKLLLRALVQMIVAAILAILCLPLGLHWAAHWLTKASANLGKFSTLIGLHYQEYA